jgi:hypothetical protein
MNKRKTEMRQARTGIERNALDDAFDRRAARLARLAAADAAAQNDAHLELPAFERYLAEFPANDPRD